MAGVRTDRDTPPIQPDDPRPCILFSLAEETSPYLRTPYARKRYKAIPVGVTGVGAAKAARVVSGYSKVFSLRCVIVCGFAGGLSETLQPGNLILADRVTYASEEIFCPDSPLFATAESVRLPDVQIQRGTLVTADRVLVTAQEKRQLAERTGAIAVDMETAGAVRMAQEIGIPWLAVRAITDGVNDDLPLDFNALANPDGSVNRGRVIRATLAQPSKIPALIRLGKRSSLAANNLAAFLIAFLQTLPDETR